MKLQQTIDNIKKRIENIILDYSNNSIYKKIQNQYNYIIQNKELINDIIKYINNILNLNINIDINDIYKKYDEFKKIL